MLSIEYRYFYQSALDSSIRKASQNLNINSSAIVRQIQKLEDRLQTKLFIRNARGLELTEEGKLLFDHLSIQNETNQNFLSKPPCCQIIVLYNQVEFLYIQLNSLQRHL